MVGNRAVETDSQITPSGMPDRQMEETEQEFFEVCSVPDRQMGAAQIFLPAQLESKESQRRSLDPHGFGRRPGDVTTSNPSVMRSAGISDDAKRTLERTSTIQTSAGV